MNDPNIPQNQPLPEEPKPGAGEPAPAPEVKPYQASAPQAASPEVPLFPPPVPPPVQQAVPPPPPAPYQPSPYVPPMAPQAPPPYGQAPRPPQAAPPPAQWGQPMPPPATWGQPPQAPPPYGQQYPPGAFTQQPYGGQVPPSYGPPPGGYRPPMPGPYPAQPQRRNRIVPLVIGLSIFLIVLIVGVAGIVSSAGSMSSSSSSGGGSSPLSLFGGKIGLLYVEGVLGEGVGYDADTKVLVDQVHAWHRNSAIKAIVVRVNSPGGAVSATQDLYAALNDFRAPDEKGNSRPVLVSMGDIAASGGYYTALAADEVYANEGTLTGSIGVIMNFMDYQGLQDKVGIKSRVVKSGEFKDIGSGSRAMTLAEKELLGEVITDVYEQFLDATVDARMERVQKHLNPTNPEAVTRAEVVAHVKQYADGRIFSGRQAANTAMIDGIKNLDEVIRLAATKAGLDPEKATVVRAPVRPQGLFGTLGSIANKMDKNPVGLRQGVSMEYRFAGD